VTGMVPSRLRPITRFNTGCEPSEPKPKRHCTECGGTLTWNPDTMCCLCRTIEEQGAKKDHRTKIDPATYPALLMLREEGTPVKALARICNINVNYMSTLLTRLRKETEV
jgi:hypothetical protein